MHIKVHSANLLYQEELNHPELTFQIGDTNLLIVLLTLLYFDEILRQQERSSFHENVSEKNESPYFLCVL